MREGIKTKYHNFVGKSYNETPTLTKINKMFFFSGNLWILRPCRCIEIVPYLHSWDLSCFSDPVSLRFYFTFYLFLNIYNTCLEQIRFSLSFPSSPRVHTARPTSCLLFVVCNLLIDVLNPLSSNSAWTWSHPLGNGNIINVTFLYFKIYLFNLFILHNPWSHF